MKICILTPRFPYPQYGGDVLRINEIACYLKSKGHTLVLVSLSDESSPDLETAKKLYDRVYFVQRKKLHSYFFSLLFFVQRKPMQCGYYASAAYEKLLRKVVADEQPDLYISHLLRMAPYLERLGLQRQSIIEMTDALSRTYSMSLNAKKGGLLKFIYHLEKRLIARYEQHVIHEFPKTVLVSESDEAFLRAYGDDSTGTSLCTYTNGVHCVDKISEDYEPQRICFVGNMRTLQNQDAVLFFVHDILPLIKNVVPAVKFYIVGSLPPPSIQALASDDIFVTGFVDDIEKEIQKSALIVAPVRVAAGIQNKVLQAMACGVPVVLSDLLCPAIPYLQDGVNCSVASSPEDFSKACINLLQNKNYRNDIAERGYEMVKQHYSWTEKLNGYECLK